MLMMMIIIIIIIIIITTTILEYNCALNFPTFVFELRKNPRKSTQ